MVKMLHYEPVYIAQQAFLTLGNMALNNEENRQLIIETNAIEQISKLIESFDTNEDYRGFIDEGCWCLATLCSGYKPLSLEKVQPAINILCVMITNKFIKDEVTLTKSMFQLSCRRLDYIKMDFLNH